MLIKDMPMTGTQIPLTISSAKSIRGVAMMMRDRNAGVLVMVDGDGCYAGLITQRSIARAVADESFHPNSTAHDLHTPALSCGPDTSVDWLRNHMEIEGTHYPAIICDEDHKPVRMIFYQDLLKAKIDHHELGRYDSHTGQRLPEKMGE